MRKYPLYLSQGDVDALAQLLYTHQHVIDVVSTDRPTNDRSFRFLTELRRQCCQRSKAEDPYPDLPMTPDWFDAPPKRPARCR